MLEGIVGPKGRIYIKLRAVGENGLMREDIWPRAWKHPLPVTQPYFDAGRLAMIAPVSDLMRHPRPMGFWT